MTKPGRFIVVEGLEGAGKSTAIHSIQESLASQVPNVLLTREPGGTRLGERLRTLVKDVDGDALDSRAELLLMYAARVQLLEQVIRPALARGDWVIADRFELSTYAYQGGGRGIDLDIIDRLSAICLRGFEPDLTIYLDIPPTTGLERARQRGQTDRIEQESLAFFERVHQAYLDRTRNQERIRCVDASLDLDSVQALIRKHINAFLQHHDAN